MSGFQSAHYREYMRHYSSDRLQEALSALQAAASTVDPTTPSERIHLGAFVFREAVLLHRLLQPDAAVRAFARAEQLLDKLTFAVEMATFYARFGNDAQQAVRQAEIAIQLLIDRERVAPLDDGELYYRRLANEVLTKQGRFSS